MGSDLPIDLLEDIFLRLDDTADLARASAVCTSFRRIISDGRFLRRFRSLHRRPVLGLLVSDRSETALFYAAQPPRRSAQAAAGFTKAASFNFAFLPDRSSGSGVCDVLDGNFAFLQARRWSVCDVRDGRVLLYRRRTVLGLLKDLVIYDPLHRRHAEIPTIPSDVVLAGNRRDGKKKAIMIFDSPFLVPAVDEDEDESLQVVCIAQSRTEVVAFVFSSSSRQWRRGTFFRSTNYEWTLCYRQHVYGCVCWPAHHLKNVMLVFDTREIKFYIYDLPHESFGMLKMAVEAGDGRLGLLLLGGHAGCTTMDLYSKARQGIQEPQEWRHDRSIPKITGFHLRMLSGGVAEGYALLLGIPQDQYNRWICDHRKNPEEAHYFTLDLKTSLVEKLCVLQYDEMRHSFLYASFPPPFSPPSVGNCKKLSLSLPVSTTETCDEYIGLAELFY